VTTCCAGSWSRPALADEGIEAQVADGWHICAEVLDRLLDGEAVQAVRGRAAREHGFAELRDHYSTLFTG
jgi:hypothetical protein